MQINETKFNTAYRLADENTKKILDILIENNSITERIKTLDDAIGFLGEDHYLVKAYNAIVPLSECTDNIEAYIKLQIIAAALNEEYEPPINKVAKRYYPWFVTADGIVSYADVIYASSDRYSFSSYRLALKTKELAEYMCTQFIDIWEQYLLG